jgi:CheY-like chemotaxis protein
MQRFVLVVEDERDLRQRLCQLVAGTGHAALGAADGQEALEIIRARGQPCLILLDVAMPVMNGPAFRAVQLQNPTLQHIPVAVMIDGDPRAPAAISGDVLLEKPLTGDDARTLLERFCAHDEPE